MQSSSKATLVRLLQAEKILDELIESKEKEMVKDGFNIGTSQLNMLKAWSTDKDDKNPLIRTMAYSSTSFPYLAKNNRELERFPKSLIAKVRDKNGSLTDANLKDARHRGKLRVSKNSLRYWLEHGSVCDDKILEAVKFINSTNIRKVKEYNGVNFQTVTTGQRALTRRKVQTEIPALDIVGKRNNFYSAIFEGDLGTLGLSETDQKNLEILNTEVLSLLQNPDDIVRIICSMTNKKIKYIPLNQLQNISLIEMRHAIESDKWHVIPTNVPSNFNMETKILRTTCALLIHFALQAGGAARRMLNEMMERTFIGEESISYILKEKETCPDLVMAVCQATLGKAIPPFKQFNGVTFFKTKYYRYLANLHPDDRIKLSYNSDDKIFGKKTVVFTYFKYEVTRKLPVTGITNFSFLFGVSEYHIRFLSSSAEVKVRDGKLENMTIQTKSKQDVIQIIAATITHLALWNESEPFDIRIRDKEDYQVKTAIFYYFCDPKKWPFTEILERRPAIPREIQLTGIPIYKEIVICDTEATSYGDLEFTSTVDETTLEVRGILGASVESYDKVMIPASAIKNAVMARVQKNKYFPNEVFSIHPVLITQLGADQRITLFFLECFEMFAKNDFFVNDDLGFQLSEDSKKNFKELLTFDDRSFKNLKKFIDHFQWALELTDYKLTFSLTIAKILVSNFEILHKGFPELTIKTSIDGNAMYIYHRFFSMSLPELQTGTASLRYDYTFKVGVNSLFNLKTKQVLVGSNYFEFPNLEECTSLESHSQLMGVPISALKNHIGKHVILAKKCFIIKDFFGKKTMQEILENIQNKQTNVQAEAIAQMDIADSSDDDDNLEEYFMTE